MAKLTLSDLASLTNNESSTIATINANSALIETALENTLSRDGTSPNTMGANIDMNSNRITNLPTPVSSSEPATKGYVDSGGGEATEGDNGWSPVLAVVADGARRVHQITGWVGGEGTEPTDYVNYYLGSSGPVAAIGDATDIRGASGAGSGDMVAANNLSDLANASTARTNLGVAIGSDVQAYSANLDEYAAVNPTAAGLALLDDANAAAQLTTLGAAARAGQTEMWSWYFPTVSDKTYKVIVKLPYAATVTNMTTISESGTCTLTGKVNSSSFSGSANSVSNVEASEVHASAAAAGDDIQLTVSSNSSCIGMSVTITATRALI